MKKSMSNSERRAFVEELAVTTVALSISAAIKDAQMSQREIAQRLGVTEARISQIVNATGNPTIKSLARIADVLGRELKLDFVLESDLADEENEWPVINGTWDEATADDLEASQQEQYVDVAA